MTKEELHKKLLLKNEAYGEPLFKTVSNSDK